MNSKPFLRRPPWLTVVRWASLAALIAIGCFHVYHVSRCAVNLPFQDEYWLFFRPGALSPDFSWRFILAPGSTHYIVLTKLTVWMLYLLNGWDIAFHIKLNIVLFCMLVLLLLSLKRKFFGSSFPSFPLF